MIITKFRNLLTFQTPLFYSELALAEKETDVEIEKEQAEEVNSQPHQSKAKQSAQYILCMD